MATPPFNRNRQPRLPLPSSNLAASLKSDVGPEELPDPQSGTETGFLPIEAIKQLLAIFAGAGKKDKSVMNEIPAGSLTGMPTPPTGPNLKYQRPPELPKYSLPDFKYPMDAPFMGPPEAAAGLKRPRSGTPPPSLPDDPGIMGPPNKGGSRLMDAPAARPRIARPRAQSLRDKMNQGPPDLNAPGPPVRKSSMGPPDPQTRYTPTDSPMDSEAGPVLDLSNDNFNDLKFYLPDTDSGPQPRPGRISPADMVAMKGVSRTPRARKNLFKRLFRIGA